MSEGNEYLGMCWDAHDVEGQEVVGVGENRCTGQEAACLNVESTVCGPTLADASHLELAHCLQLSTNQTHPVNIYIQ